MPFPSTTLYPSSSTYPGGVAETMVLRERQPDNAALYVQNPDGSERRIGGDELSLPLSDYTIASQLGELGSASGGFTTMDGVALLPEHEIAEFGKFSGVSMKLGDRTTIWEGRLESTPEHSPDRTLTLSGIGHGALLTDNPAIVFLGVDNDMTAWEEPPGDYIDTEGAAGRGVNTKFALSTSENALSIRMEGPDTVKNSQQGTAWYLPPMGTAIGNTIQYIASDLLPTNMDLTIATSTLREDFNSLSSGTVNTSGLTVKTFSPTSGGLSARIKDTPTTDVTKTNRAVRFYAISVFGNHGLQPRDVADGVPQGLYFSDILEYLLGLYTSIATSANGTSTIESSSNAMASAVWADRTDLRAIIEDGLRYEPDKAWAIWEGPTFYYKARENFGRTWTVRRQDGAELIGVGPTSEPDYDRVVVEYQDGDGATKTVGYPNSGANTEDSALLDPDPDNPAKRVGGRVLFVQLQQTNSDHALAIGQVALSEALKPRLAGEVQLPRYAEREGKILPTNLLRAGDRVVDGDSLDREEMPLISASYQRGSDHPLTATVDTPANRLDAAIAGLESRPHHINRQRIRKGLRRQRHHARKLSRQEIAARQKVRRQHRRQRRRDRRQA